MSSNIPPPLTLKMDQPNASTTYIGECSGGSGILDTDKAWRMRRILSSSGDNTTQWASRNFESAWADRSSLVYGGSILTQIAALGGKFVGSDIPESTTRVGSRQSMVVGGSDVAQNVTDKTLFQGVPVIGVSNGATLIQGNANWLTGDEKTGWRVELASTTVTATQLDSNIVRIQTGSGESDTFKKVWSQPTSQPNASFTFSIQVKQDVGSNQTARIAIVNSGSDTIKAQKSFTATSDWKTVSITGTTDGAWPGVRFNIYGNDNTNILYRFPNTVQQSVQHPFFSAGSAALATHGTDLVSCTLTGGSEGTIMQGLKSYNWTGSNWASTTSPPDILDSNSIKSVVTSGTKTVTVNGSGYLPIIDSGVQISSNSLILSADWNGSVIGARFNNSIRSSSAETDIPSGSLYIGNRSTGIGPFHGILITVVFPTVLSDAEYATVRILLEQILDGVTLK